MSEITEETMNKASKTLATMLDYLGLDAAIKAEDRGSKIVVIISSDDAGRIIGRKGKTLESLQMLLNRMMQKGDLDFPRVFIDIDGYSRENKRSRDGGRGDRGDRGDRRRDDRRDRRNNAQDEEKLRQQAMDAAKEVKRWGESVTLPAMNAHDRRIIHVTLQEEKELKTVSEGDGNMKKVVISLKG